MKRKLLLGISALALLAGTSGLVSCVGGGDSSSTPDSSFNSSVNDSSSTDSSVGDSSSTTDYPSVTISLSHSSYTLEVGAAFTLRVSIEGDVDDFSATYSTDNDEVVSLPDRTEGISSGRITGLSEGVATITVTSTANPNVSATCVVTVIAAKPTPYALFTSLYNTRNYTLTSTITGGSYDYQWKTYLTDDALVSYQVIAGQSMPVWVGFDENGNTSQSLVSYGIFVDEDDYASYISYSFNTDENGHWASNNEFVSNPQRILSDTDGFLTRESFDGAGVSSPANADSLYASLSCISPSYFTNTKNSNNVYEIDGTSTDISSTYVEYGLLKVFANDILMDVVSSVASGGYYYLYDVATAVDTTLTINDENDFTVTITWGSYTIEGTISNVGTTTMNDFSEILPTLAEDIQGVTARKPQLGEKMSAIQEAFEQDNYVHEYYSYFRNGEVASWFVYYAEDYVFVYYPQDYIDLVNQYGGTSYDPQGEFIYVDENGHLIDVSVTIITAEEGGEPTEEESMTFDTIKERDLGGSYTTIRDVNLFDTLDVAEYYSNTDVASSDDYYYFFSEEPSVIWQGDDTLFHYTYSKEANILSQDLIWGELVNEVSADRNTITGISTTEEDGEISEIYFNVAWEGETSGRYSMSDTYFRDFGSAEESNDFDAQIRAIIDNTTEEEEEVEAAARVAVDNLTSYRVNR